ncbi:hypothetical protein TrCOL_g12586 [Triparma columacea]|uniref:Mediator of RNA polymerase II transcription subunit 7 n=1 Tax=Triparma columacea TaxID=722753 RepID=A0A9W7LGW2_9STRA|nr:hypothetical protein TrCOL_g12586 [Triparma columacea]
MQSDDAGEPDGVLVLEFPPPPPHWRSYGLYIDKCLEDSRERVRGGAISSSKTSSSTSSSSSSSQHNTVIHNAIKELQTNLKLPTKGHIINYFTDTPPTPSLAATPSSTYKRIINAEIPSPSATLSCSKVRLGLTSCRSHFLSLIPSSSSSKSNTSALNDLQNHLTKMHEGVSEMRAVDAVRVVKRRMEDRKRTVEKQIEELEQTIGEVERVTKRIK